MKYRFTCPNCGHGQESSFVRIGAQVSCPQCEEVFRIEPERLEGGGASGLGAQTGKAGSGPREGGEAEEVLGGEEPEALVGLSGLSGLMNEAEGAAPGSGGEELAEGSGGAGAFPSSMGKGGSFKGAAETGAGVDAFTGSSLDDEEEPVPAASPAPPPPPPVQPPPTRDQLRRERAKERADKEERKRGQRRVALFATVGAVLAAVVLASLFVLLTAGDEPVEAEASREAEAVAEVVSVEPTPVAVDPGRVLYAREAEPGAPEQRPGVMAEAMATPDPLSQTRRLEVVLVAGPEGVPGPVVLFLEADAPGGPSWSVNIDGGLGADETRRVTVALVPPLPTRAGAWTATVAR